ncbi:T9SS type A sorting domain-containing protein [Pontibacter sp. G13]|uniref:T9SS type A sorting domain-containing protein n=1 Tax=Pontibacter sp. G13 TaxID=3074898 RepID=UPI00288A2273|nr:T9SS type A sorting domain-containing protein [Pontibacter sp. G13]WNJ17024.1 T9SS type A sorting domain-containing protein [Pontibacter sp. G13]
MKAAYSILLLAFTSVFPYQLQAQCDRAQMVLDYQTEYLGSSVTNLELDWTGDVSTCDPGTISELAQTRTLQRINYFRQLVGLPLATEFDSLQNINCQAAALMMDANDALDHDPPPSWDCFTQAGAQAAGSSNLARGAHSSSAIRLFMYDEGVPSLGHRRWIIKPNNTVFGHGSTPEGCALYVFGSSGPNPVVPFTAYPSPGFFPAPLADVETWSFSIPGANFGNASVSMIRPDGSPISLTPLPLPNGFGDPTIGFTPTGILTNSPFDETYTIQINQVLLPDSTLQNYTYEVTIAPVSYPPQCPDSLTWSEDDCACTSATNIELLSRVVWKVYPNPATNGITLHIDASFIGASYRVLDLTGQQVEAGKILSEETSLSIDHWPKGVYLIQVMGAIQLTRKFIKE